MLIKVKIAPDNDILWDMGTCYIVTEHQGFIEVLESITDWQIMACFLDDSEQYYTELVKTPIHYDKEIDLSEQVVKLIKDDTTRFRDKLIKREDLSIPKVA